MLIRELSTAGAEGTSLTVMTTVGFTGSFVAPIAGGWFIGNFSWLITFGVFALLGVLGVAVLIPLPEPDSTTAPDMELES